MKRKWLPGLIIFLIIATGMVIYWSQPWLKAQRVSHLKKQAEGFISKGEFIDAELSLRQALKLAPNDPEIHFQLARVLEKEGLLDQAREHYLKSAQAKNSPEPSYNAGLVALKMRDTQEAERLFAETIARWPHHLPSLYQLGWLYARKGKYEEALLYFEKIIGIAPNEAEAYNNLGYCFYNLDQPEKAREMFQKALELKPDLESAKKSLKTIEEDLSGSTKEELAPVIETSPSCK